MAATDAKRKDTLPNGWTITRHGAPRTRAATLIVGLPGVGNVGKVVADYLIGQLKARLVLELTSHDLPNTLLVTEEQTPHLPCIRLYAKRVAGRDVLILAGDAQPRDEGGTYRLCEDLLELRTELDLREVLTLGGIGLQELNPKPTVYALAKQKSWSRPYTREGANPHIYGKVGPIIGITGVLVGLAQEQGLRSTTLLVESLAHPFFIDLRGAKALLQLLARVFSWKLSLTRIDRQLDHFEEQLHQAHQPAAEQPIAPQGRDETTYIG